MMFRDPPHSQSNGPADETKTGSSRTQAEHDVIWPPTDRTELDWTGFQWFVKLKMSHFNSLLSKLDFQKKNLFKTLPTQGKILIIIHLNMYLNFHSKINFVIEKMLLPGLSIKIIWLITRLIFHEVFKNHFFEPRSKLTLQKQSCKVECVVSWEQKHSATVLHQYCSTLCCYFKPCSTNISSQRHECYVSPCSNKCVALHCRPPQVR